jgi:hypothetical protein
VDLPACGDVAEEAAKPSLATASPVPPLGDIVSGLRELHRQRQDFQGARKKIELQIKAVQRREHARSCEKPTHARCAGVYERESATVELLRIPLKMLLSEEKAREKPMVALVKQLPVYKWAADVRGFGALGLGQIIAEAGDLSLYANPAKLWSRMGVGLGPNVTTREPGSTRYEGRSPRRASVIHVIADSMLKGAEGEWRAVYDDRKAYEQTKPACLRPIKTGGVCKATDAECCRAGHIHNRALRYLGKRLLRELWRAWRGATQ